MTLSPPGFDNLLAPYDPTWPQQFAEELARLRQHPQLREVSIEHVGSTAVPDMPSKPTLDILLGIDDCNYAYQFREILTDLGYTVPAFRQQDPHKHTLERTDARGRHYKVQIVQLGAEDWRRKLSFRNELREDPALRQAYLQIKLELAARHASDAESYNSGKKAFQRKVIGY